MLVVGVGWAGEDTVKTAGGEDSQKRSRAVNKQHIVGLCLSLPDE